MTPSSSAIIDPQIEKIQGMVLNPRFETRHKWASGTVGWGKREVQGTKYCNVSQSTSDILKYSIKYNQFLLFTLKPSHHHLTSCGFHCRSGSWENLKVAPMLGWWPHLWKHLFLKVQTAQIRFANIFYMICLLETYVIQKESQFPLENYKPLFTIFFTKIKYQPLP